MNIATSASSPVFSSGVRWCLRVLSWTAFLLSAYLAWKSVTNASVAGCGVGGHNGCDVVLNSSWSKLLGLPIAVLGLACYASLAALSVLLGIQGAAGRWIHTAFIALAFIATGASIWFIGLQTFVIGDYCLFCLAIDICGILIGTIVTVAALRHPGASKTPRVAGASTASLSALKSAIPATSRTAPIKAERPAVPISSSRSVSSSASRTVPLVEATTSARISRVPAAKPAYLLALSTAIVLLTGLVSAQVLLPSKPFDVQQVALNQSVQLGSGDNDAASAEGEASSADEPTGDGKSRVAMRIPPDESNLDDSLTAAESTDVSPSSIAASDDPTAPSQNPESTQNSDSASTTAGKKSRKVKFLGGKLELDTYEQPIIGSPQAPHVVVEMISYDCSHCRKTHQLMKKALSRYGDQVALVVLNVPLDSTCNKLVTDPSASHRGACATAKTACAIAKIRPQAFPRFHDFLMTGQDKPPALDVIVARAYKTVDGKKLREVRDGEAMTKQIQSYVDLYAMLQQQHRGSKSFGLPVQIIGDEVMSGGIENVDDIYKIWEKNLDLKLK